MSALVYGFEPGDLSTVAAAGVTLAAVAALAGAPPAVHAPRIEPAVVVREGGQSP